jgi:hypothetical protein
MKEHTGDCNNLDVYREQYSLLRQEVLCYLQFFKNHVNHMHLMLAALMFVAAYILSNKIEIDSKEHWWIWYVASLFLVLISNYLTADIFYSLYNLSLLGAALTFIESRANELAGFDLFFWESYVVRPFLRRWKPCGSVRNVGLLVSAFLIAIFILVSIIAPIFFWQALWRTAANLFPPATTMYRILLIGSAMLSTALSLFTLACGMRNFSRMDEQVLGYLRAKFVKLG